MKYMTKEWYDTMQKTSFHLLLKVAKRAEVHSEAYFNDAYKREEKIWLKDQEDLSNVTFEEIYPEEFEAEYLEGNLLEPGDYEEAKREYFEMREAVRSNYENPPPFDPAREKKNFRQLFRRDVRHLEENLPVTILQKVEDIRVLALNRASADVKREITAYCKANEKVVESTLKKYWVEYRKAFKEGEPDFAEDFRLHDCKVISCRRRGKDLVVTIDNSGGFTTIDQVIFRNCSIRKQEGRLNGSWWLYDEIYRDDDGYEIHGLLQKKDALMDFIIHVTGVEYR